MCNKACGNDEVCSGGNCALECVGGTTKCGSSCVNTNNDPAHCGACSAACMSGEACFNGNCVALACYVPSTYATVQLAADALCSSIVLENNAPATFSLVNPPQSVEIVPESLTPPIIDSATITVNQTAMTMRTIAFKGFALAGSAQRKISVTNTDALTFVYIGNVVIDNHTTNKGAIYLQNARNVTVRDSSFSNNVDTSGSNSAAVIYVNNCINFQVLRNVFKSNATQGTFDTAGVMYIENSATTGLVSNNLFDGNNGNGNTWVAGGIFMEAPVANISIVNNTFVNNSNNVDADASSIRCQSSCNGCVIKNNISWNATGNQYTGCASATLSYNNFRNSVAPGTGNISSDPLLTMSHQLQNGSPSINAGDPAVQYNDKDMTRNDQGWTGGPAAK
jgi:hypothetical protein